MDGFSEPSSPALGSVPDADPHQLLQRLVRAVREHMELDVAFIGEVTDDERIFRYVDSAAGVQVCTVGDSDPLDETYCAHVLSGLLPAFLVDPADHPVASGLAVTTSLPMGTYVSVPIVFSTGDVYGTFCCFSSTISPDVGPGEVRALRMVAELAGERLEAMSEHEKQAEQRRQFVYDVLDERTTLDLVFQPLWDLETMKAVGLEALSRFPDLGLPPDVVFADAASVGLGVELELHVVEIVLREFHRLPDGLRLNINVSPDTLMSERFKPMVSGYPRDRLVIEVTEHAVVKDYAAMREVARQLSELGIWLAIDDVGMGFSGLNQILESRPNELKLDAAVIRDVHLNPVKQALVEAFCSFGQRVGYGVVVEGIENGGELAELQRLGAKIGQGFLLGRPMPLHQVLAEL